MNLLKSAFSFFKGLVGKNFVALVVLALHVVGKINKEMPKATGKEKRDKAIEELLEAAETAGIEAGENIVRFLVECGVASIKNKVIEKEAAAAAPPPAKPPKKPPAKPAGKK